MHNVQAFNKNVFGKEFTESSNEKQKKNPVVENYVLLTFSEK